MIPLGVLASARVTSAPTWTPADIASTVAWFDASESSTITQSGGTASAWASRVGSLVATQATGTKQPSTSATLNGRTVLTFDGSNDAMATSGNLDLSGTDDLSVWALFTCVSGGDRVVAEHSVNVNSNNAFLLLRTSANRPELSQQTGGGYASHAPTATITTSPKIVTGTADRALATNEVTAWLDGDSTGSRSTNSNRTGNFSTFPLYIGGRGGTSLYLSGYIAELGVCSSALPDADREKVEGYLAHKWGLAANLPGGHPYKSAPPT